MFYVRERVLCIDGSRWGQFPRGSDGQKRWCPNLPNKGAIYTVRSLWDDRGTHLQLVEIINPPNLRADGSPVEPIFESIQFVSLKRVETSITVFTEVLARYPAKEKV